jgi:hypothetical protein
MAESLPTILLTLGIVLLICGFAVSGTFLAIGQWRRLRTHLIRRIETHVIPEEATECRWLLLGIELFSLIGGLAVFNIGIDTTVDFSHTSGVLPYLGPTLCALALTFIAGSSLCASAVTRIIDVLPALVRTRILRLCPQPGPLTRRACFLL